MEDGPQERWFEPTLDNVSAARRFAAGALPLADGVAQDIALLVSELAANAVLHAGTPFRVSVRRQGSSVTVEVLDRSPEMPVLKPMPAGTDVGGRGLAIVDGVAAQWGCDEVSGVGKSTWFRLDTSTVSS